MRKTYLTFWTISVKKLKEEVNIRRKQRREVTIRKTSNKKWIFRNNSTQTLWIPKCKTNHSYQESKMMGNSTRVMMNKGCKEKIKEKDFLVKSRNKIKTKIVRMKLMNRTQDTLRRVTNSKIKRTNQETNLIRNQWMNNSKMIIWTKKKWQCGNSWTTRENKHINKAKTLRKNKKINSSHRKMTNSNCKNQIYNLLIPSKPNPQLNLQTKRILLQITHTILNPKSKAGLSCLQT